MPIPLTHDASSILIRRAAWERSGIARADVDRRCNLTADEFRVEGQLVVIGPLFADEQVDALIAMLEDAGLAHFDDFFDLSGNWPGWLSLLVSGG
ncbi:MAG TPA: hypothetical protein VMT93_00575 [Gemmatimonadaceae bacterium]|nr:hypothetical protein [Gemmatimonadaceae bacterium]